MRHPALRLPTQAYLHLRWPAEHEDPWQVVDRFCTSEPLAARLPDEITDLLRGEPSEDGRTGCAAWSSTSSAAGTSPPPTGTP